MSSRRSHLGAVCVWVAALLLVSAGLPARAQAQTGSGVKLTFDAVSVRVSSQRSVLSDGNFLDPVGEAPPPKGGLFTWNVPLVFVIDFAYDLRSSQLKRQAWESPQNADISEELGLPPVPMALEKQLGLKLVKKDAQIDVFVMDHIGTLTEN